MSRSYKSTLTCIYVSESYHITYNHQNLILTTSIAGIIHIPGLFIGVRVAISVPIGIDHNLSGQITIIH